MNGRFIFCIVLAALLGGCAGTGSDSGARRYHDNEIQSGRASWYGSEQGRHTASGERFNPRLLTAAHRHLPFGTIIRVTNENNGRSVEVRINDRGPWSHGRILDVTSAAADVLRMKRDGIVPVEFQIIRLGTRGSHHREN